MEFDLLRRIICEVLNVSEDEITMETSFVDDLGADSIDLFQVIMGIEEELDIEVDTDSVEGVNTVGDALELINNTIGQ